MEGEWGQVGARQTDSLEGKTAFGPRELESRVALLRSKGPIGRITGDTYTLRCVKI